MIRMCLTANLQKTAQILVAALCLSFIAVAAQAAENLRLARGISYDTDLDKQFPIIADKMDDVAIEPGKPTYIFFGAPGDLNTNRHAKRVVDLYKRFKTNGVKFIVIDVDHPTPEGKALIKSYYQGYIPAQVVLDKNGSTTWTHSGEVAPGELSSRVEKVI
jgi:hypothetical protein